jgi:hypothetical protein
MSIEPKLKLPPVIEYAHGITCIDTLQERPRLACCYLVRRGRDYAFIEAGTAPCWRRAALPATASVT